VALAAVKRSVYFGGSMSLSEGLHVERAEFLTTIQSEDAQDLMSDYLADMDSTNELPFYNPDAYARAIQSGSFSRSRSRSGR
jgi:hypothetical protein